MPSLILFKDSTIQRNSMANSMLTQWHQWLFNTFNELLTLIEFSMKSSSWYSRNNLYYSFDGNFMIFYLLEDGKQWIS